MAGIFDININPWILMYIISMIPFIELRGAAVIGTAMGLPFWPMFFICLLGNITPIPFVIYFGRRIFDWLGSTKLLGDGIASWKDLMARKAENVLKYGPIALITFVGIPIPGTGGWGGAIASVFFDIPMKTAVLCIFTGLIIANLIMLFGSGLFFGILGMLF